jgi:UDP-N-acetylglucosamine 2-epimerase (non-hydrolysing)
MTPEQSLTQITTRALKGLDCFFADFRPDFVFVQGDTTTTFAAGLSCFYREIPFGHIEAGLRTDSITRPFPEEFNRRAVSMFASQHYAPTLWAASNLYQERLPNDSIFITGNTGIDAVKSIANSVKQKWFEGENKRILLLTTHRRENWGEPQRQIAHAMIKLLDQFPDTLLVVSMHPNPSVRETLVPILGDHPRVHLIDPPHYPDFVKLIQRSYLIFTDSGGIQEEAPTFGVPVAVLRECTERPEGIQAGTAILVGTSTERIYEGASRLLSDPEAYQMMAKAMSPYGDGHAARRIRYLALSYLGIESPKEIMWISSKPLS